jgi:acetyl esterase/lipase
MVAGGSWAGEGCRCGLFATQLTGDSPTSYAPLMEDLARQCQAAIVFPCYTRAPEKQFPFQLEQTYGVLDHILRNAAAYRLEVKTFALAGDSAGGIFTMDRPCQSIGTDNS